MQKLNPDSVIVRSETLTARVDGDLVFFDPEAGKYFATGGVGADIWELIESPRTIREICSELVARYDVEEDTCLAEVLEFAADLVRARMAKVDLSAR